MKSHVIMFILFNLLVNLQGVHANLWSTWVGDKEETSSSRDVTRRTGDVNISSDPDLAIEDVEASSEDAEIITWPVTSMTKRKTTRRKLRVHKVSYSLSTVVVLSHWCTI
jgi:hypothetical protein